MNPSTGTFTTMDTYQGSIFDPVSLHKYLYANANPVTYVDPSGYMTTHQDLEAGMAGSAEIDKAQASHSLFAFKVFKNLMKKVASGVAGGLIAVGDQVSAGVTDRDQLALAFRKGFLAGFAFSFATGKVAMALGYSGLFVGVGLAIQSFREGNFWQGIYRLSWSVIGGVGVYKASSSPKTSSKIPITEESPESLNIGAKENHVYIGVKDGEPVYVGITKNVSTRQAQHGSRFDYLSEITESPLTRREARAIEQAMIERHPEFQNKINSINPKRDWYNDAINWGNKWLENHGIE